MVWLGGVALATFLHVCAFAAIGLKGQDISPKDDSTSKFSLQTTEFESKEIQISHESDIHEKKLKKNRIAAETERLHRLIGQISEEEGEGEGEGEGGKWFELNKKACRNAQLPSHSFSGKKKEFLKPLTSKLIEKYPKRKYVLVVARQGLGNSLAGFSSSFVFSLLSGRRLVVILGNSEDQAFDTLCDAFYCNPNLVVFNQSEALGDSFKTLKQFRFTHGTWWRPGQGGEKLLRRKFHSKVTIMTISSDRNFDHYWFPDEVLRNCVFESLQCETLSCVYSRAVRFLITGGAKEVLEDVIKENVKGVERNDVVSSVRFGSLLKMRFDIAVHIRTVNSALEGYLQNRTCEDCHNQLNKKCNLLKTFCENLEKKRKEHDERREQLILRSTFWKCLGNFFRRIQSELITENNVQPILSVFLATDNEKLRPKFVELIGKESVCYFSSGTVQHTFKNKKGNRSKLPTLAEFYLLSRARFVLALSLGSFVSTFASEAAYYGNSTRVLFDSKRQEGCRFFSCSGTNSWNSSVCKVY